VLQYDLAGKDDTSTLSTPAQLPYSLTSKTFSPIMSVVLDIWPTREDKQLKHCKYALIALHQPMIWQIRVLSMGIDRTMERYWLPKSLWDFGSQELTQITDVACGTGDLLIYWQKNSKKLDIQVEKYIGVDPSVKMLEIAKDKVKFADFLEGKAQELPIADSSTDTCINLIWN